MHTTASFVGHLPLFPILFACVASLAAQCPLQTVVATTFGTGCSAVSGTPPIVSFGIDAATCRLVVRVEAAPGCCNTYLQGTVLVLGAQATSVPLPVPDAACVLLAQPDMLLLQAGTGPGEFSLPLPMTVPTLTFVAQGAGIYFTTVAFPAATALQWSLTSGYTVTVQ